MNYTEKFIEALETNNLELLRQVPKSDLHNHAPLGFKREKLKQHTGINYPNPPAKFQNIPEMDTYISSLFATSFNREGIEFAIRSTFEQAKKDGVTVLAPSVDSFFCEFYPDKEIGLINFLDGLKNEFKDFIDYRPEIGIARTWKLEQSIPNIQRCIETGFFNSIDLYGDELGEDLKLFIPIFRKAKQKNMILKAHVGEFGNAASIKEAVDTLELNQVQHGISAVKLKDVMSWLRNNNIQLNICPTSNVMLGLVDKLENHPAKELYDNGIKITINSDDILIFNQSVSEEYLNLFNAGLFSSEELNNIRLNGIQ